VALNRWGRRRAGSAVDCCRASAIPTVAAAVGAQVGGDNTCTPTCRTATNAAPIGGRAFSGSRTRAVKRPACARLKSGGGLRSIHPGRRETRCADRSRRERQVDVHVVLGQPTAGERMLRGLVVQHGRRTSARRPRSIAANGRTRACRSATPGRSLERSDRNADHSRGCSSRSSRYGPRPYDDTQGYPTAIIQKDLRRHRGLNSAIRRSCLDGDYNFAAPSAARRPRPNRHLPVRAIEVHGHAVSGDGQPRVHGLGELELRSELHRRLTNNYKAFMSSLARTDRKGRPLRT